MSKKDGIEKEVTRGRREFLGQLAAGAAAGAGVLALSSVANAAIPGVLSSSAEIAPDADHWLDGVKGKHKQLVDAYEPNDGWPLGFTHTFLATQGKETASAVLVLRHFAMPIALNDALWAKYKIGASLKITDPGTKEIATKNPFLKPKSGVLLVDDMSIDRLLGRGVVVGACSVALQVLSGMFAANAGVTADAAKAEWTAGILPGITLLPSGVWGVNRAQEKGCTYVTGGG
jgi:hypothetical protein